MQQQGNEGNRVHDFFLHLFLSPFLLLGPCIGGDLMRWGRSGRRRALLGQGREAGQMSVLSSRNLPDVRDGMQEGGPDYQVMGQCDKINAYVPLPFPSIARPAFFSSFQTLPQPMMRPQSVVEPGLSLPVIFSVLLHLSPLLLLWLLNPEKQFGTKDGQEVPQVEMVFDPPAAPHSQQQQKEQDDGGSAQAPPPSVSSPPPIVPQPAPPPSKPDIPAPVEAPPEEGGELNKRQDVKHPPARTPPRQKQKKRDSASAARSSRSVGNASLAHPMDWSFNGPPSPPARHRGHHGGRGPIDFSLGPLSMNGRINAPYRTKSSVKGVSSDYGAEIDRWVRAHMYYPEDAVNNGDEGPSSVHVVIDRTGRVRSVRLTGQSGSYQLDAATTGMFQGAKLPPVPPDMSGDHFDLDVTINYILIRH